jgi:hypothetical protein
MNDQERNDDNRKDVWDRLGETLEMMWRALGRLIAEGNRRQLALRDRKGEVMVRLPLTVAALIALFLLWTLWPVLLVLAIVLFAMRGSLAILRREAHGG